MPSRTHSRMRALRTVPQEPVLLSNGCPDSAEEVSDLGGRLKVIPIRDFIATVPLTIVEGYKEYTIPPNPINQLGPLLSNQIPVVTSNDKSSLLAAFNKRLNFLHVDDIVEKSLVEALELIGTLPDLFDEFVLTDSFVDLWCDSFAPAKQSRMRVSLLRIFDMQHSELSAKDISVKLECLLKRLDATWAPRIICAGSDAYNALTGPLAKEVMTRLLALLAASPLGPVEFKLAYKCSDVEYTKWVCDTPLPHWAEGDFSRNDSEQRASVTTIYLAWLRKLKMPDWFIELERSLRDFSVKSHAFGIYAKIMNQLPTGATNTTNRNSMYNMTMFAVSCRRQNLVARAVVLGDDIIARTSNLMDCMLWTKDVASFRMVLKASNPTFDGEATILSRRIIHRGDIICSVPKIGKALARFNARATANSSVSDDCYMAGKALSYAYEFRHVPFLSAFFLRRHAMYNVPNVDLELTWSTRSNGIDSSNIVAAIANERTVISDDIFLEWSMDTYELGLCDWQEIMTGVILSTQPSLFEHPSLEALAIDF